MVECKDVFPERDDSGLAALSQKNIKFTSVISI